MSETAFVRLLETESKETDLAEIVALLRQDRTPANAYLIDPASFHQVPGSPFSYWAGDSLRQVFRQLPALASGDRDARLGTSSKNDQCFIRAWWEVDPASILSGTKETTRDQFIEATYQGRTWVPYSKGGIYAPFYADLPLVMNWRNNGGELKKWIQHYNNSTSWSRHIISVDRFFQPGLTWPRRTQRGLSLRALPAGCIFGDKGPAVFAHKADLPVLLSLTNSAPFLQLVALQMAFGSYEVGVLQRTPLPHFTSDSSDLGRLALNYIYSRRSIDTAEETSHAYTLPALQQVVGSSLSQRADAWNQYTAETGNKLAAYQQQIDEMSYVLYGISIEDRFSPEASRIALEPATAADSEMDDDEDGLTGSPPHNLSTLVADLLSYTIGTAFGRWDLKLATGECPTPELSDPFAPLPVCSPGMLTGEDGLPLREAPPGYPLDIDDDGILPDDPDHPGDIVQRVREVLELLWQERAEAIEAEARALLGVKDLRDYFRNPTKGFFDAHIKKYSRSRRKAPIYWLLQSPRKQYGLWVYYHRLDGDLLFKALTNYVEPKIARESNRLEELRAARNAAGAGGQTAKGAERAIDKQEALLSDLRAFRDRLAAAANLGLTPDLNDGVLLTIAPLHEVVPWKEARNAWDELTAGTYGWSSIGQQLRAKGLVKEQAGA